MSRADSLKVYEQYNSFGNWCRFVLEEDARTEIEELETELAQRDTRIAELEVSAASYREMIVAYERVSRELERERADSASARSRLEQARAEVPEWCREFMAVCVRPGMGLFDAVEQYADQLRACGI